MARQTTPQHDRGVRAAKAWLRKNGYTVKIPPTTGNYKADAYGEKETDTTILKRMIEVETDSSIYEQHAKKQMMAFSNWSAPWRNRKALLTVPKSVYEDSKIELPSYDDHYYYSD